MLIRRLKEADHPDVARLYCKVYGRPYHETDEPLNQPISLHNAAYGVFLDDKLIGAVTGVTDAPRSKEDSVLFDRTHVVSYIFVDPDPRYRRRGIAERLLATLTAVFDSSAGRIPPEKNHTISLIVEDNEASHELHEKLGFKQKRGGPLWKRTGFSHVLNPVDPPSKHI